MDFSLFNKVERLIKWRKYIIKRLFTFEKGSPEFERWKIKAEWCTKKINFINDLYKPLKKKGVSKHNYYVMRNIGVYDRYTLIFKPYDTYPADYDKPIFGTTYWLCNTKDEYELKIKENDTVSMGDILYMADRNMKDIVTSKYAPLIEFVGKRQVGFAVNKDYCYCNRTKNEEQKKENYEIEEENNDLNKEFENDKDCN